MHEQGFRGEANGAGWRLDSERDAEPRQVSPGKVALTSRLQRSPSAGAIADSVVQRMAQLGSAATPADPIAIADRAVQGSSSPMPHRDLIQAAFGCHDVSEARAHVGGDASAAASSLSARAFAYGQDVVFDGEPDLHTAAHEAAHVVQQRAGISFAGGMGAAGDAHEVHADAVADAVVRGDSAEALLDQYGSGGNGVVVQARSLQRLVSAAGHQATVAAELSFGRASAHELNAMHTQLRQGIDHASGGVVPLDFHAGGEHFVLRIPLAEAPGLRDQLAGWIARAAPSIGPAVEGEGATGPAAPAPHAEPIAGPVAEPVAGPVADPVAGPAPVVASPGANAAADAALSEHVGTVLASIPEWIHFINDRVNPSTTGGELVGIDPILSGVVQYYRSARATHETKVSAGAAVEASQMAFVEFVLGMLPGLGDVAGVMSVATPFLREVEDVGPELLTLGSSAVDRTLTGTEMVGLGTRQAAGPEFAAAALGAPMGAIRGRAASRTTAPLTAVSPTVVSAESGDRFALRAEQSKTAALRALLQCAQTGSSLAEIANQAQGLPEQLLGDAVTPEARQVATAINGLRLAWPNMHSAITALTHGVDTARQRLIPVQPVWSPAQLEVYIWLLWMAALGEDGSSHIDPDPIEDRLATLGIIGPGSITGVDFGMVTEVADEMAAVQAARRYRRLILNALETYGALPLGGPG